jgi:hypothetical protein
VGGPGLAFETWVFRARTICEENTEALKARPGSPAQIRHSKQIFTQRVLRVLSDLVPSANKAFITFTHAFGNRVPGKVPHDPAAARAAHGFPALIVFKEQD